MIALMPSVSGQQERDLKFCGEESRQKVLEVSSFAEPRIQIFENRVDYS